MLMHHNDKASAYIHYFNNNSNTITFSWCHHELGACVLTKAIVSALLHRAYAIVSVPMLRTCANLASAL